MLDPGISTTVELAMKATVVLDTGMLHANVPSMILAIMAMTTVATMQLVVVAVAEDVLAALRIMELVEEVKVSMVFVAREESGAKAGVLGVEDLPEAAEDFVGVPATEAAVLRLTAPTDMTTMMATKAIPNK